jgi:hypothetical protein
MAWTTTGKRMRSVKERGYTKIYLTSLSVLHTCLVVILSHSDLINLLRSDCDDSTKMSYQLRSIARFPRAVKGLDAGTRLSAVVLSECFHRELQEDRYVRRRKSRRKSRKSRSSCRWSRSRET